MSSVRAWLRRSGLRIAPFAGACVLAWLAGLVGGSPVVWWEYLLALALALVAGSVAWAALLSRRFGWVAVVPCAVLLLAAVGLLRDSAGGVPSGAGALAILPVFQTALYSRSRRDLGVVLVGLALFFLVPIWVVGSPTYPPSQYRTVVIAVAVDAIIGLTTQALVARVKSQVREAETRQDMLEQVAAAVRGLFDSTQPRSDACEAVMRISGATSAVLYEPLAASEQLICTATAGVDPRIEEMRVARRSAAYDAMRDRQAVLITNDVESHVGLIDLWIAAGRPSSLLYQPLLRGDSARGVLIIGWPSQVRAQGPRATVAALLAHEIAAVISRADTLEHLSDEARTDALTGLPNRRAWERHLRQLSTTEEQMAIGILDLDHFKQFNDTHGHPAGDRLLKETAAAWRNQLRPGDVLARIGGEEFGLLLLGCDAPTAVEVTDRLRRHVSHARTCSAGITLRGPEESSEHTIARADSALYEAKQRGRNQTRLLTPAQPSTPQGQTPATLTD